MLPIDARITFGEYTSTQSGEHAMNLHPVASALRTIVPRFPGSRTDHRKAANPSCNAGSKTVFRRATANIPGGVSRVDKEDIKEFEIVMISALLRLRPNSRLQASFVINTSLISTPDSTASLKSRFPSIIK